jgi:hypothetical protein
LNAAAVPFFLLFGYVLDQLCSRTRRDSFRWAALGAIAMIVIISQLQLNAPAFQSRYNFFHR